mgnify:CR=1 FL=1
MYRKAFEKDRNISKIARLLKQNAVDCNLNKEGNTSQENLKGLQINSRDEEIDVSKLSDTTIVTLTPNMGDEIQMIKSGIMEIANIFVINNLLL